jgi:glycosyltransferase involved in cell wall biosynthesis
VCALAARTDELVVLARDDVWRDAPPNVTVRTFDARSKVRRAVEFERALAASLSGADGVLVHMVPSFLALAAPLAKARGVPLLLWYTHWHASRVLRLATALADTVLSVDASSFPLQSPKVRGIGHAIDVEAFAATLPSAHSGPLRLLALGRTARWKGLATLLDALVLVLESGADVTLEIRGPSLTDDERDHRRELATRIAADVRLRSRVELLESVPRADIPALLASVDVVVSPNEPRTGATLDKAVYEAAACARAVVSTNQAFAPLLEGLLLPLLAPPRNPQALADVLATVAAASAAARADTGCELRRRVVEEHSLGHWADAVISVVREVRSSRGG